MDILLWILLLVAAGFILYWMAVALVAGGLFGFFLLPAIAGLVAGIWIWWAGHDNIGMLVILAGFVGQFFWQAYCFKSDGRGGSTDPMNGKSRIYNASGDVVGYRDND